MRLSLDFYFISFSRYIFQSTVDDKVDESEMQKNYTSNEIAHRKNGKKNCSFDAYIHQAFMYRAHKKMFRIKELKETKLKN